MAELFKSAITGYVRYFNRRHGRNGALFEGPYRAVAKHGAHEIQTAIAYVHLNHPDGPGYEFCSHNGYIDEVERPDWINVEMGLAVFGGKARYEHFLCAYGDRH